jgi:hypothetical protein
MHIQVAEVAKAKAAKVQSAWCRLLYPYSTAPMGVLCIINIIH